MESSADTLLRDGYLWEFYRQWEKHRLRRYTTFIGWLNPIWEIGV